MDIVVIFNGMGNQMSQYAYYLAKKKVNPKTRVMFDYGSRNNHCGYDLERAFGLKMKRSLVTTILQFIYILRCRLGVLKYLGIRVIYEPSNNDYTPSLMRKGAFGINYFWGGWHSEKNFIAIQDEVKATFSFRQQTFDARFMEWMHAIDNDDNSVSIHIRRGDYLNLAPSDFWQLDGVATLDYYQMAIDYIRQHVAAPHFYVFSNDLDWCREQFGEEGFSYVECNQGLDSWRDMYLMSECRHHINANSTFSWWGAWLCKFKESIIICPEYFIRDVVTKDFYPSSWHKIGATINKKQLHNF